MTFRRTALFLAVPALVAGMLVSSPVEPAEAASYSAVVTTKSVAMYPSGSVGAGKVYVQCRGAKTCKGTLQIGGDSYKKSYAVKGRSGAYVTVWMHRSNAAYPYGKTSGGDYEYVKNVRLTIDESSPRNIKARTYKDITTETRITQQQIAGNIVALGGVAGMSDLRVELIRPVRGGNTQLVASDDVSENGSYSFTVALGTNNSPSASYRIKIRGVDSNDDARSWYYRGADGDAAGGGRYLRDATAVQARKSGDYDADFRYASLSGKAIAGAKVTVAAPPPKFTGNSTSLRELDYPRCGDVFGHTTADDAGDFKVNFLPATTTTNNRYMVSLRSPGGTVQAWYGATPTPYGSCYDATDYKYSKANLITLAGPTNIGTREVRGSDNSVTVKARFAFKPTSSDRWIRIREKVPGVQILDSPVVAELQASSSNSRLFTDLRPGTFWIEVGRRTGCSTWYPSRYADNRAYFKGADRGAERWKTVKGSKAEYAKSIAMGFPRKGKSPGRGYKGWMYRGYCKAYGAGTYTTRTINGYDNKVEINTATNPKGAVVKGHVSRAKGKTNKEIMVRLSSSDGKRVIRTDFTDGGGNFYIAGLPSGRWTVSVNSDSWRGIGRTFTGKHSVSVKRGHGYNIHTLRFKG